MDKFNLDTFTLKLAIGTIWFVSIFLFTCGFYNIFPFVEELSKTSTWGIVVTIPTIVFSYTLGGIATYLSNTVIFKSEQDFSEIENFLIVSEQDNEFISKRYETMRYQYEFFKTCIPTVIFLGFSVIWSSYQVLKSSLFEGEKIVAIALGILTMITSLIIRKMTSKQKNEIEYFTKKIKGMTSKK